MRPGDLFLFFGWFRSAELVADHWRYVRGSKPVHALWGWLLIDAIHSCRSLPDEVARWAAGHPHLNGAHPKDDVFVAADEFVLGDRRLPGAGVFVSRAERTLTAPGATPSHWRLPAWMHPDVGIASLSYHRDQKRWSVIDADTCGLSSVSKGQEFVLETKQDHLLRRWLEGLFDLPGAGPSSQGAAP